MAIDQKDFDEACSDFTRALGVASRWKHSYWGAAYSTRLEQACDEAQRAIDKMRKMLERDRTTP